MAAVEWPMRAAALLLLAATFTHASKGGGFAPGAPRYWPKFGGARKVELLDGSWSYGFINGYDSGFDSMSPAFKPKASDTPNKTAVPSCSDIVAGGAAGYLGPRGVAMYATTFASPVAAPVRLQFQSCSFYCRVFVTGHEVGDHRAGGYVAFWLDVAASVLKAGDNELFVIADNRFNATTAPMHTGGDFWHYGGLTRSVELHTMPAEQQPVLWRAYALPSGVDFTLPAPVAKPDSIDLTLVLTDASHSGHIAFSLAWDDGAPTQMKGVTKAGELTLSKLAVPSPKLWSPTEPNLHTVTVTLNGGSVTERFGLRSFGTDKQTSRLTINGEVTKLVGWNHHTQWPVTAASPTDDQVCAIPPLYQTPPPLADRPAR